MLQAPVALKQDTCIDACVFVGRVPKIVISMDFGFVCSGNLKRKATGEAEYVTS